MLWITVKDCLVRAAHPHKINIGVVDQSDKETFDVTMPMQQQVRYVHMHSKFSKGACWARSITSSLYDGEDYILQVDAHTLFNEGWDVTLVQTLEKVRKQSPKAILSTYPFGFDWADGMPKKTDHPGSTTILRPAPEAKINLGDPTFRILGSVEKRSAPCLAVHIAAGFLFTTGEFFQEVPYDPFIYFFGEEHSLTVRAWTHGWDIYNMPDVPMHHLYHSSTEQKRPMHWNDEEDKERIMRWWKYDQRGKARMRKMLLEGGDLGIYGLGTARTLQQFALFSGIDYPNRSITNP